MDQLRRDVRFAFRSIRRNPGISLIAVISLALGIGANASIFSAVDVFMLQPLPFPEADELVTLRETNPERGIFGSNTSMPTVMDWRTESRTMEIAGFDDVGLNMSGGDQPERLAGLAVTHNFFDVLGVQPARGRGFLPVEEREGSGSVLVMSDGLWQRSFGGDPEILGQVIGLDGEQYTVVGVMAPGFEFDSPFHEIWIPMENPGEEWRATHYMEAFGRIRSGSSVELARAETSQIQTRLGNTHPELTGWGANVVPLRDQWFGAAFQQASAIASVAVFLVLLIACANVANLLLARGAGRAREIALRGALGAERHRIARQLLTESVILAFVGGAAGFVVAVLGIRGVVSLIPPVFPQDRRDRATAAHPGLHRHADVGLEPDLRAPPGVESVALQFARRSQRGRKRGVRWEKRETPERFRHRPDLTGRSPSDLGHAAGEVLRGNEERGARLQDR